MNTTIKKIIAFTIVFLAFLSVGVYTDHEAKSEVAGLSVGGSNSVAPLPVRNFLGLTDTPNSYTSQALKVVRVNAGATALEFATMSSGVAWGAITGTLSDQTDLNTALGNKQPLDSDLTTIAGLTATTDNFIISNASAWASRTPTQARTSLGLVIGTNVQAYDADLTTYAGITPSANIQSLLGSADYSTARSNLGLAISSDVQAYDADLTTYAGITPSANVQTLLGASNYSAFKTSLSLNNVENTALSTWAGTANITTLGTIATGTWSGTAIAFDKGGTGLSSASDDTVMVSSGSAWVAKALANCTDTGGNHLNYATATNTFSCGTSGGGGGGLTVGTTTVASGTDTRILYDNAGTLGEYVISGSGNVAMTTSPVFTTPNIGVATGSVSGNAGTATALASSRTLWGQSFDGTGNVTGSLTAVGDITGGASNMAITSGTGASRTLIFKTTTAGSAATTALTIGADQSSTFAGTVALGANNLTMTGSLAATGARVTKGWFTDLESTNMPTVGGTAILTSLTAPQFTTIELSHATANTLSASGGILSIESVAIPTISSTDVLTNKTLTTPVINGTITGTGQATAATASTITMRDAQGNITGNNWLGGYTTTATAAGTTTLTVSSTYLQYFTGVTTQTVKLPVVSTLALGTQYVIVNNSTGAVTVQSSGTQTVVVLAGSTSTVVTSIATSGTDQTVWSSAYSAANVTSAKKLSVSNTLTLAGTDSTTMTFPTTSATIARTDAGNTFTGASTASAWVLTSPTITTSLVPTSDDGAALGDTTHNFSDLFLASGAVLNYANGNVAITHTSGILTMGTGTLKITNPTNTATSVVTIDGTQTLTNKSIAIGQITGLGTGVATWLATPSSANLASAITDETGSGLLVFGTAPVFASTMTIGTASGTTGAILFKGTTSGTVTLTVAAAAGTYSFTLPTTGGSSGQYLTTDGSGTTSWATPSGSAFPVQDVALVAGTATNSGGIFASTSDSTGTVVFVMWVDSTSTTVLNIARLLRDTTTGNYYITHTTTLTISANNAEGLAVVGSFLYVNANIGATGALRRYSTTDLSGVTTMTISGTNSFGNNLDLWSDGTNLFVTSSSDNQRKYTISGTTVTDAGTVGFTGSGLPTNTVSDGTNVYMTVSTFSGTVTILKYAIAGGAIVSTTSPKVLANAWVNGTSSNNGFFLSGTSSLGLMWQFNFVSDTAKTGLAVHMMAITKP